MGNEEACRAPHWTLSVAPQVPIACESLFFIGGSLTTVAFDALMTRMTSLGTRF